MTYGFALFPGQGAQHPGMGKEVYEASAAARAVFDCASQAAGLDVAQLCFSSTLDELSRTIHSQIAIFTHSMAVYAALQEAGVTFSACAGFSLGEYTALAAAGVISLADAVQIVCKRGQVMQRAADAVEGGMAAVLGLDDAAVEQACAQVTDGLVRPVNYNCPGQLVIAGERRAIEQAVQLCRQAGARRAVPLAVSGAFHTPLMQAAAAELRDYLQSFTFSSPSMPVYSNLDGRPLQVDGLPEHLERHMVSPVRWKALMQNGLAAGLSTGCEIGPGKTLTGFAKKIDKSLSITPVETMDDVRAASATA